MKINFTDFKYYFACVLLAILTILGIIGLWLLSPIVVLIPFIIWITLWAIIAINNYHAKVNNEKRY